MTSVTEGKQRRTKDGRRANGEGTKITQRADGKWQARIMLGRTPDGRLDRPWVIGDTQREVQRKVAELKRKAETGTRADPSKERQTVETFMDTWLNATRGSVRVETWEVYRQFVRVHITPTIGKHRLSALRPDAVQTLYAAKLAAGLAPNTVRKIHSVLHRALKMAVKWGYLPKNPADDADRPAAPKRDLRLPTPAELTSLIDKAVESADQLAPLWTVAIHTGLRRGELLGLSWADVDLDNARLTVRRTLTGLKNHTPRYGEPKSQTSRRTVWLASEAVTALRQQKATQNQWRLKLGPDWPDLGLVFTTHVGTPLSARNVLRSFKLALTRAGLPSTVRLHDMRHSHATNLLRAGVSLKVASGRLGHSSVGITADLYQHVASDMDQDAAERAAQVLRATPRQQLSK